MGVEVAPVGLPIEEREMVLDLLAQIRQKMLTPEKLRDWDACETFPEEAIRELLGPKIGLQLLFIPEEYGGMGGGARDIAAISEEMAKICLGVATAFLAIHLGADPILVGATHEQKEKWLGKLAEEGAIVAYAVTEPEAGSNLQSFKTTAAPVLAEDGAVTGYRITGNKQFISNGGYADFLTVLAQTPEGPSFFIVEKGTPGFVPGKAEDKHGIRSSNTAPLAFDNVFVPIENLVGWRPRTGTGSGQPGLRVHPPHGRLLRAGSRGGRPPESHPLRQGADPVRQSPHREAGLHPQAHPAVRGQTGGGPGVHRGSGGAPGFR